MIPTAPRVTEHAPLVSVIVPTFNGASLLPDCLRSLEGQTYQPLEILVVDDGSTDSTPDFMQRCFPKARLRSLPRNRGFAHAVNEGIRASNGAIVVLLNNDAVAEPQWVAKLVAALERHPHAGMIASKMLLQEPAGIINAVGDLLRRSGVPDNRGVWEPDGGQYDQEVEVFGASGGAAAYRRTMLDEVGLFDERFFMYCEDVDLAIRAQLAGYRCVYAPGAVVHHRLSATGGGSLASFYSARNIVWLLARDVPRAMWTQHWPLILGEQVRRVLLAVRHGREPAARAQLGGLLAGLRAVGQLCRERPRVADGRGDAEHYLLSLLT
ncbi:MAG: hypothetical protein QOF51_2472 [Chloroflexota bacterium]|nr:hypothetical protein [Chloroflexota bacterium]